MSAGASATNTITVWEPLKSDVQKYAMGLLLNNMPGLLRIYTCRHESFLQPIKYNEMICMYAIAINKFTKQTQ